MKPGKEGYRVAVVGASSLLGRELVAVLEEEKFPVSRLVTFDADDEEPELPIIDLGAGSIAAVQDHDVTAAELDFAFITARQRQRPEFLGSWQAEQGAAGCQVIDLVGEGLGELAARGSGEVSAPTLPHRVSIPFLDRRFPSRGPDAAAALHVSAHPGVIVIGALLLRLAARFPIQSVVAQVFLSASESGSRGIEELQKQTVNLLSFQKIPRQVFGAQLAFNLLSRLGSAGTGEMAALGARLRRELHEYLGERVPPPALRVFQVPVFFSVGVSLYIETAAVIAPEAAAAALAGERVRVRRTGQEPLTPVDVTGSSDILVDTLASDTGHPTGLWLWALADNFRLAATNAVELAASLRERARA